MIFSVKDEKNVFLRERGQGKEMPPGGPQGFLVHPRGTEGETSRLPTL